MKVYCNIFFLFTTFLTLSTNSSALASALNEIYKEVLSSNPSELVDNLPTDLSIELKDMNQVGTQLCETIPVKFRHASYSFGSKKIYISSKLYHAFLKCPLKLKTFLKRKIAHELFHAYDYTKKAEFEKIPGCRRAGYARSAKNKRICKKAYRNSRRKFFLSGDIRFRNIAQLHGRNKEDFSGIRNVDPYELESPAEFAAINFEAFIFDSEYKCRRPTLYRYYESVFKASPFRGEECHSTNTLFTCLIWASSHESLGALND